MKKSLLLASSVFACGYSVAIAARFADVLSFDVLSLSALVSGAIVSGLVGLAFSDYTRKPRFRVRHSLKAPFPIAGSVAPTHALPACDWTYTTRSA